MDRQKEDFKAGWSQGPGICGAGSKEEYSLPDSNEAIELIEHLRYLRNNFKEWGAKPKINEAGCGDMEWLRYTYGYWINAVDYHGYDIADRDGQLFNLIKFKQLDITTEQMRPANLILSRLVFIHLPNERIQAALDAFRKTGAKYLIADFFLGGNDKRHKEPSYVGIPFNLAAAPFNLKVEAIGSRNRLAAFEL